MLVNLISPTLCMCVILWNVQNLWRPLFDRPTRLRSIFVGSGHSPIDF